MSCHTVQLVTGTCIRRPSLAPRCGCPSRLVTFCWCCSCWRVFFLMIIFKSLFFSFTTVVSLEKQRFISYSESLTNRAWGEPVPGQLPTAATHQTWEAQRWLLARAAISDQLRPVRVRVQTPPCPPASGAPSQASCSQTSVSGALCPLCHVLGALARLPRVGVGVASAPPAVGLPAGAHLNSWPPGCSPARQGKWNRRREKQVSS